MKKFTDMQVYIYCNERWDFYERLDGGYYPSKHDNVVLEEAAKKFKITAQKAQEVFSKISKIKADKENKNISNDERMRLLEEIVRNNKDNPWSKE